MRKDGGLTISSRRNSHTGYLDRGTILHKRYRIQDVIGQGGMGAVYLAVDTKDQERYYAIKEMSLSMITEQEQPQAIQNFRVEAKILWGLNHPNLPTLEGFFSQNDRYFLVMEYIDGDTLENYLERKGSPFPERRVLEWARQLCDVMEYLHSQRPPIIFRDMKPGNIMLSRSGQIKLIDFGIARFFRPATSQDTQILGTPGYAPPEQYGKAQTDERSDIYALGMTVFHLLTNKLSEQGFGLENVHRDYPRISPNVARALEKATSIKPDDRFQTIQELRHALFDVGVFVFESGDIVATPEEMAHMCFNYPEEAADYLYDGEIEAWLLDMGENELATTVNRIVQRNTNATRAVEQFVQAVAAQNTGSLRANAIANTPQEVPAANGRDGRRITPIGRQMGRHAFPLAASPRVLDFGTVFPGISAALVLTISSTQGGNIRGTIHCYESWIQLSKSSFDGDVTDIHVRVNSLQLDRNKHYSGEIVIALEEDVRTQVVVKVVAEVQGYVRNKRHPGRTHGADLDYDADESDSQLNVPVVAIREARLDDTLDRVLNDPSSRQDMVLSPQVTPSKLASNALKYLQEPQPSSRLQYFLRLTMAFTCAFMTASLGYTLFASRTNTLTTQPGPHFILMLGMMIPAATFGAVMVLYERTWEKGSFWSRALTGMSSSLCFVSLCELLWQAIIHASSLGWIQLLIMLVVASAGATVGVCERPHERIMRVALRLQRRMLLSRWGLVPALVLGGLLSVGLVYGFPFGPFTVFGILLASGIMLGFAGRINTLLRAKQRRQRI